MGRRACALLVALQVISLCSQPRAAAAADAEGLPPLLSPIINVLCDAVQCGKGSCKVSSDHAFGYVCECEPGWTKIHFGDHFQFLPCVIPNCTFNHSCSNSTMAPGSLSSSPPSKPSLFDPCAWSYCGDGNCLKTSEFGHRCDCEPGYANLLNATIFPCFKECVYGADCASLGLMMPHVSSPSSSSTPSLSGHTASIAALRSPRSIFWIFLLMVPLAVVTKT